MDRSDSVFGTIEEGRDSVSEHLRLARRSAVFLAFAFYALSAPLTSGHCADFGKQWLAARLVATGQGKQLYELDTQRAELERHFDREVIDRGIWRDGIGGPTYPPTLAVLWAPLGLLEPAMAQWVVVEASLVLVLLAALAISRHLRGCLPWEVAALIVLAAPSFFFAIGLGQNTAVSLVIFTVGWTLLARDRAILAGVVWGLFAYKPTWGLAVAWVPLVVGRPHAYGGMAVSAGALVAFSSAVCGLDAWRDWLEVAGRTEEYYNRLPRWIGLSRDLPGLFARLPLGSMSRSAGLGGIVLLVAVTAWLWRRSGRKRAAGPASVLLLSAAVLSCPRFMFYDITLAALPIWIGLAGWSELGRSGRMFLVGLTGCFLLAPLVSYAVWKLEGPPLCTVPVIGLWFWAAASLRLRPATKADGGWGRAVCDAPAGEAESRGRRAEGQS